MRVQDVLRRATVLIALVGFGNIGCGGDDAAVVEPPAEAAAQQEITIEREVVDGKRMLIAYDGAQQQLSTFQTDVTEAGIETTVTVGTDASRTVMRTTIDEKSDTYSVVILGADGQRGSWQTVLSEPGETPDDYVAAIAPFQPYEAVWLSALDDVENARFFNDPNSPPTEPGGGDTEYSCAWVCGIVYAAGCWKVPGWWGLACALWGVYHCGSMCIPDYASGLMCFTSYEGCGPQTCQTCCQKYYGCNKSCWGGCY
jgi:hypothetical protein